MEPAPPEGPGGPARDPRGGRARAPEATGQALERAIETLLERRRPGATICPSEAARIVAADRGVPWRPLMAPARDAAGRLADEGRVEILQRGELVDVATAHGPVRIRVARSLRPGC